MAVNESARAAGIDLAHIVREIAKDEVSAELQRCLGGLTERERCILDMWPKFEDGEYVWFRDFIEHEGATETVQGFKLYRSGPAFLSVVGVDTEKWLRIEDYKSLKRPAQSVLDADGMEIKVGDTVWLKDGSEWLVEEVNRHGTRCLDGCERRFFDPKFLTHTRPDSWERLEEDACNSICGYFGKGVSECDGCPANAIAANSDEFECCERAVKLDIVRRAKALAAALAKGVER